ncbi:hypothetical protein EDB81DRAFT_898613 [Dactylonectria macrodidyma]|uniref:Xylanolytic transcriptional activator regulatory domain-containing protein n=1 Tax=Dactylonectria macrodidyma TaxID=307937 RepID=A0A9P9JJK9_9HYPO|nr:hypothetical protein EDB81DRAFT_898613 [Dactylonectria macrodidyma]
MEKAGMSDLSFLGDLATNAELERATPCSNCVSARLDCTHSAIKPRAADGRQRILISAQYERKIDEIAHSVDSIKQLLQNLNVTVTPQPLHQNSSNLGISLPYTRQVEGNISPNTHSQRVYQFVDDLIGCRLFHSPYAEGDSVMASLREVMNPEDEQQTRSDDIKLVHTVQADDHDSIMMPPQAEAVVVLRWARDHPTSYKVVWLSQIFALEKFTDICQKVYFAVSEYRQTESILANGCLSWLFSEYAIVSNQHKYLDYSAQCRSNVQRNITRLPLVLPATMEMIACLVVGAHQAIEDAKATLASALISAAVNLCQTLGCHRTSSMERDSTATKADKMRLFWSVYRLDAALSVRLGRTAAMKEHDIPLPSNLLALRWAKFAEIQTNAFSLLFSPSALQQPGQQRIENATSLVLELQALVNETRNAQNEVQDPTPRQMNSDPMRTVYLEAEQVVHLTVLALVSRVAPLPDNPLQFVSNYALATSRAALDAHQRGLDALCTLTQKSEVVNRHLNCTILSTPFVPFLLLFCRVISECDQEDLERLESFVLSLSDTMAPANCLPTRPKRFFVLLHDMAKQYYEMHGPERNLIQASEELGSFVTVPCLDENGWCLPVQESQIQDTRIAETLRELPSDTISEQNTGTGLG